MSGWTPRVEEDLYRLVSVFFPDAKRLTRHEVSYSPEAYSTRKRLTRKSGGLCYKAALHSSRIRFRSMPGKLVLVRHGQSAWNLENLFTGWVDVDLTDQGRKEAQDAGRLLKAQGFEFDLAFTSVLKRAIRTLWITLDEMDLMWLPVERSWRLNERHYGALQGLNKAQTVEKHGAEQVKIWRRSYDIPPPALNLDDNRHPRFERRYADLSPNDLPASESLKDTLARVKPYWDSRLAPALNANKNVLVVAHGNSLRALVKMLDGMSDAEIVEFNIPTGIPIYYELDNQLKPKQPHQFLGDQAAIKAAADAVAKQTEKK